MIVRPIMHRWLVMLSIGLVLMYALTACAKAPPNSSETVAPTLTWKVLNLDDHTTQTYTGNASINTKQGTGYTVTLIADDLGGVHQITLGSSSGWQCISNGIGQSSGPSLDKTDVQNLNPDSNGDVLTSIFLIRSISMGPYTCQAGYTLSGASTSLFGTSTNFSNHEAKATLTFKV